MTYPGDDIKATALSERSEEKRVHKVVQNLSISNPEL
jgi:hypothetical protein